MVEHCEDRLNGHEFEKIPGDGEGQGSLACCSPWGRKELDMMEQPNNNFINQGRIREYRAVKRDSAWGLEYRCLTQLCIYLHFHQTQNYFIGVAPFYNPQNFYTLFTIHELTYLLISEILSLEVHLLGFM